jgi:cell division protein ZapA
MPRQPVRVQIFNQNYSVMTESDPRDLQEIAREVDDLMASIASRTASVDSTRVAVLACLHLADKLHAAERQLQLFEDKSGRIATLLEEALEEA